MKTTLNKIKENSPCKDGWKKLLKYLNKTEADDKKLKIKTIIKSNGVDDAVWCLRTVEGYEKEIKLFAIFCARQVQHLMTDSRSIRALDVAEDYVNGKATREELDAAADDAYDATADADDAYSAANAAYAAATYDAYDAAIDATNAYVAAESAYVANVAANVAAADSYAAYYAATYDTDAAKELMRKIQTKELMRICRLKKENKRK